MILTHEFTEGKNMGAENYISEVKGLIKKLETTQMDTIRKVAALIGEETMKNEFVYVFGAGHSNILATEVFVRAGGLVNFHPIFDSGLDFGSGARRQSVFERMPGYIQCIMQDYQIKEKNVIIIISTSGINPAPVEVALEAKKKEAVVVAITSLAYAKSVPPRDPSGKKLYEIADFVIDNGCPPGDALVSLTDLPPRVGAGSTVIGAIIMNSLVTEAAEYILKKGNVPPIVFSGNLPQGDEYNQKILKNCEKFVYRMRNF